MDHDPIQPEDRARWQRFCRAAIDAAEIGRPDLLELAGYLDGRLDPEDHERIEAALAAHPDLLAAAVEVRAILAGGTPEAAPERVRAAAGALVPFEDGGPVFRLADWRGASRWIAAAAASVIVCVIAYRLGTSAVPAPERDAFDLVTAASFGALDGAADEEDLFALALTGGEVAP